MLGHADSITARFFGVPAAMFHLFSFFKNKYDSRSLKCLFLSTSPIASPRVCWGVQIIVSSVLKFRKCLTLFYNNDILLQTRGPYHRHKSAKSG